jgi:hypothetical protein
LGNKVSYEHEIEGGCVLKKEKRVGNERKKKKEKRNEKFD